MKIKATFRIPRVNFTKFRRALQEELSELLTRAAFEWLGSTTAVIPVWSGASMATFQPLASKIGMTLAISPTVKRGGLNMGLNNATGEFIADADKGKFEFTYSTTLAHLIYNEFNNANISPDPGLYSQLINPGPYRFQEKGLEAFQRVAADARLPEPTYTITTIRVR